MVSCKTRCLIQSIVLWNSCVSLYQNVTNRICNLFNYLQDYYYGHHDTWVFINGHTLPISLNHFYNKKKVSWIYDNYNTTLEHSSQHATKKYYKLSWLSAKILINEKDTNQISEYDMDPFLESFLVKTTPEHPPTLSKVFHSWCAYKKHWFHTNTNIELHIIDHLGEDHVLDLVERNFDLFVRSDKIYVRLKN
jgi:hypothetical protein